MNPTTVQIVAQTVVELAKLALAAYGIQAGKAFLMRWLETRSGLPLFPTPRFTKEMAIDAARKFDLNPSDIQR